MTDFKRIRFAYFPAEAELPVVKWFLNQLDEKLSATSASLLISDMKWGRAGLEISWDLVGLDCEAFEEMIDQEMEWICRKANQVVK